MKPYSNTYQRYKPKHWLRSYVTNYITIDNIIQGENYTKSKLQKESLYKICIEYANRKT